MVVLRTLTRARVKAKKRVRDRPLGHLFAALLLACSARDRDVTNGGGGSGGATTGGAGGSGGAVGGSGGGSAGGTSGTGGGTGGTAATGGTAGTNAGGATGATGGAPSGGGSPSGGGGTGGAGATGGSGCPGTAGPTMVQVPGGYCIDSTEVTNAQYAAFVAAAVSTGGQDAWCTWNTTFTPSGGWPGTGKDGYPVAYVDWCDAYAFCKWAGKRLCGKIGGGANAFGDYANPTASQWYASCSAGGTRTYPYGSAYQGTTCNGADYPGSASISAGSATGCEGGYPGIFDLSGNVWEWEDSCKGTTGNGDYCRLRGGSFLNVDVAPFLACGSNMPDYYRSNQYGHVGFRCCSG